MGVSAYVHLCVYVLVCRSVLWVTGFSWKWRRTGNP